MRRLGGLFLLVLLGFGVPFALGEFGARAYFSLHPAPYPLNQWAYLAQRPPPYADADYFGPEFVRESMHSMRRPDGPSFVLGTFRGKHINVIGGVRATTDRPDHFENRVLVFGGSTVFSIRVPDAATIPSHLQRLLSTRPELSYAVTNLGSPGNSVNGQFARLSSTQVDPGDVVIFYDGLNDLFNPIYVRAGGRKAVVVQKLNRAERELHDLRLGVGRHSALLRLLFDRRGSQSHDEPAASTPAVPEGVAEILKIQDGVAQRYWETLVAAHRHVVERGGSFYHFLQPNLYIQDERSPHEQRVMRTERQLFPGFEDAVRLGYPKLREAATLARAHGVVSLDLSRVIEERSWEGDVYFDRAHVNHRANALMAQHIFDAIFPAATESD